MKTATAVVLAACVCMLAASCRHLQPKPSVFINAGCVIETAEPDIIAELTLDGDLIFSGKTRAEKNGNLVYCKLKTTPGDHELVVTAPGYAAWKKTITIIGGTHEFWAQLQKQ